MKRLLAGVALLGADGAGRAGAERRRVDGAVRRQLPDRAQERHGRATPRRSTASTLQVEDAQNDVAKQLNQIKNFVASGVDAIIVNPVDTSATQAMSDAAAAGGIPLVYVNREPINVDTLPDNQAFVASDERESGTLETKEICRLLKEAGKTEANVYVIMGELSNQAAQQRTQDIHDVIAAAECGVSQDRRQADRRTGSATEAQNLMTNWLSTGAPFDAVIANNDEMAIGAIQAMKAAGIDMDERRRRRRRRHPGRARRRCRRATST